MLIGGASECDDEPETTGELDRAKDFRVTMAATVGSHGGVRFAIEEEKNSVADREEDEFLMQELL